MADAGRAAGVSCYAYCLMFDHVHLIVVADSDQAISDMMHTAVKRYAEYVMSEYSRDAAVWDEPFMSCALSDGLFEEAVRLVETHPMRAGLVESPECWPWSSAPYHCGFATDVLLDENVAVDASAWKVFLRAPLDEAKVEEILACIRGGHSLS